MGVKMKLLPSLCKVPSCTQKPQTTSFRISSATKDDIFKTINSVYVDQESDMVETPDSWFTNSPESGSVSVSDDYDGSSSTSISGDTHLEALVRGAQQSSSADHRLLFDPTGHDSSPKLSPCSNPTSNVPNLTPKQNNTPFKESVAMSLDSEDPYEDFKRSMEEMVESLGEDWEGLEELLAWYLKVNGRKYHGYIIRAFIDLLAEIFGNNNVVEEVTTSFSSAAASSLSSSASCSDDLICC